MDFTFAGKAAATSGPAFVAAKRACEPPIVRRRILKRAQNMLNMLQDEGVTWKREGITERLRKLIIQIENKTIDPFKAAEIYDGIVGDYNQRDKT